jgi:hypothetical protein
VRELCAHPRINVNAKNTYLITSLHATVQSDAADIAVFLLSRPEIQMLPRDIMSFVCISFFVQ